MKSIVLAATVTAILAAIPALAQTSAPQTTGTIPTAEGSITFTEEQQLKIKQFLGKQKPAKLEQTATIGSTLPEQVELHALNDADIGLPAVAQNYRYGMAESQVFVVDPRTRRVVGIIAE